MKKFKKIVSLVLVISFALTILTGFNQKENNQYLGIWNMGETDFINMKNNGLFQYDNQTLRTIVTVSYGGSKERIKFSNQYGTEPLEIGAVSVSLVNTDGSIKRNTTKELFFHGNSTVVIDEGAYIWSDPVEIDVEPLDKLAVSTYLPNEFKNMTGGCGNTQSYISSTGNYATSEDMDEIYNPIIINDYPNVSLYMTSIEVIDSKNDGSIVIFGDSISCFSWPEHLAERLNDNNIKNLSVIREAIVGNRILYDTVDDLHGLFGPSGISRFEDAITAHSNVKYVVALEGANDIISTGPGGTSPVAETVDSDQVIEGLQKYIDIAHKHDIKIYGATIMPFEGYISYTPEAENVRQEINEWIRNTAKFDTVIDFDKATCDAEHPERLLPQYDSGDHIHPSDAGSKAMAAEVNMDLFR